MSRQGCCVSLLRLERPTRRNLVLYEAPAYPTGASLRSDRTRFALSNLFHENINVMEWNGMEIFGLRCRVRIKFYLYSKISPGWHSSALQIASRVDIRIAFALPFFKTEMLAIVIPTLSASAVTLIFRFANMTSMLTMIAMLVSLHS